MAAYHPLVPLMALVLEDRIPLQEMWLKGQRMCLAQTGTGTNLWTLMKVSLQHKALKVLVSQARTQERELTNTHWLLDGIGLEMFLLTMFQVQSLVVHLMVLEFQVDLAEVPVRLQVRQEHQPQNGLGHHNRAKFLA